MAEKTESLVHGVALGEASRISSDQHWVWHTPACASIIDHGSSIGIWTVPDWKARGVVGVNGHVI